MDNDAEIIRTKVDEKFKCFACLVTLEIIWFHTDTNTYIYFLNSSREKTHMLLPRYKVC